MAKKKISANIRVLKITATITVGMAVQSTSRGNDPSIAYGRSPGERLRYLIMK